MFDVIPTRISAFFLTVVLAASLSGCATITPEQATTANFGPLPEDYQAQIKALLNTTLKDPYSAVYNFGTPRHGVSKEGLIYGGKQHYGWIVPVGVNARNSFGGYTGEDTRYFFLGEGRVSDCTSVFGQMAIYAP